MPDTRTVEIDEPTVFEALTKINGEVAKQLRADFGLTGMRSTPVSLNNVPGNRHIATLTFERKPQQAG